jgi:hypothetical protein
MVELVDTAVSNAVAERRIGSIPIKRRRVTVEPWYNSVVE